MKSPSHICFRPAALLAGAVLAFAGVGSVTAGNASSKDTNAPAVQVVIPRAVFDVTSSPVKDPFYPHTSRSPVPVSQTSTNVAPLTFSSTSFQLKVLSGPQDARLATINNRTVAVGEDAEITTLNGKVRIHCVDIKENSVVIRAGGQPELIELRFRRGM